MLYLVKRISTGPVMRVQVSEPQGADAGLAAGGTFTFDPPDTDGGTSEYHMSEHAARVITTDPGMAADFTCEPALPVIKPVTDDKTDAAPAKAQGGAKKAAAAATTGSQN